MKILICPDKFKGSLSAMEVCRSIGRGLQRRSNEIEVIFHPMADGGDGSLDVLLGHLELSAETVQTVDPRGNKISAQYYTNGNTAFIEVARASGLVLLNEADRNPMLTSTFGTGEMIKDALNGGYQHIYLFLGGSATNDAGMGIATSLGCQFLDKNQKALAPVGKNLSKVQSISRCDDFDFEKVEMTLLCDVENTLFGPEGAAYTYAKQKGASAEEVEFLDEGLRHIGDIINNEFGVDVSQLSGMGAAGGIGACLVAMFGAKIESGFQVINELSGLENIIPTVDLVISGEGKLDTQSLQGKVVQGVATLCQKHGKPCDLFVGKNELSEPALIELGVRKVCSIYERASDVEDAMVNAAKHLEHMGYLNQTV